MKKLLAITGGLAIITGVFLASCTPSAEQLPSEDAADYVQNIHYQKDARTGLCFAFLLTSRLGSNNVNESVTMTEVPCKPVEDASLLDKNNPA